jgi:uncharacterized protein YkwD
MATRFAVASFATLLVVTLSGIAGAAVNHLPSSPAARNWLNQCFLTLPGLNSKCHVYQDDKCQGYAEDIFRRTNEIRSGKKLRQLKRDPHLDAVAQAHAVDMARQGYFDHHSPQGMDVFDRIESVDAPRWWTGGENIAAGYRTSEVAVQAWMDSPGHKRNVLDGNYEYMGVGAYYAPGSEYGWYWVQVFASYDADPLSHDWIEPGEQL